MQNKPHVENPGLPHLADGTHRSVEPVSNCTLNFCGGVPIVIAQW